MTCNNAKEINKFPEGLILLITSLFTGHTNQVITANGLSDPYDVLIGIDQGEVISPLLWVIYIDPLLTALNGLKASPYSFNGSSTSTLAFMDDTTLVSSSFQGLVDMLNLANKFYDMNNTKINFDKASLICNQNVDGLAPINNHPTPISFLLS